MKNQPLSLFIFSFIKASEIFNENAEIEFSHWDEFLVQMKKHVVDQKEKKDEGKESISFAEIYEELTEMVNSLKTKLEQKSEEDEELDK
tara:strand:+ start:316 stop:582 length:267 start_codon:yes stop_codon:yes gene_type:complete